MVKVDLIALYSSEKVFGGRFDQYLPQKNDFESTNFTIFEEFVHNFGRVWQWRVLVKKCLFPIYACILGLMPNFIKKSWTLVSSQKSIRTTRNWWIKCDSLKSFWKNGLLMIFWHFILTTTLWHFKAYFFLQSSLSFAI